MTENDVRAGWVQKQVIMCWFVTFGVWGLGVGVWGLGFGVWA